MRTVAVEICNNHTLYHSTKCIFKAVLILPQQNIQLKNWFCLVGTSVFVGYSITCESEKCSQNMDVCGIYSYIH